MKLIFCLLILLFVCTGVIFAYSETYVSKEDPKHKIDYEVTGPSTEEVAGWVTIEDCKKHSKQHSALMKCSSAFATHFYLNGEIVDKKMDELAKKEYFYKIEMEQERNRTEKETTVQTIIFLISVLLFIAVFIAVGIYGVNLGKKGVITVYYNRADLIWNSVLFYSGVISIIWSIGIIILPMWVLYNLIMTIFVFRQGFFKTAMSFYTRFWVSLIALFILISARIGKTKNAGEQMQELARSAFWIAISVAFYRWLEPLAEDDEKYCLNNNRVWGVKPCKIEKL